MNVVIEETAIPPSEAKQIADLAAIGPWNIKELAAQPTHWRSFVLRESPPVDVYLVFSKIQNCWGYDMLQPDSFKNSASVVLAATRELMAVSKYCWNILEESGRAEAGNL